LLSSTTKTRVAAGPTAFSIAGSVLFFPGLSRYDPGRLSPRHESPARACHAILARVSDDPGQIAATPEPPYVAVIFTSLRTDGDEGYAQTAKAMNELAAAQPGYLGVESAREGDGLGITVSYWHDEVAARDWKLVAEHLLAQRRGLQTWYNEYRVRVAVVTRDYGFTR
jgi:heme-degrading monooxygenase HmoA